MVTADEIFALHPNIRWVALSTASGSVVFSEMRQGLKSHTPHSDDRAFMELGPLLMTSTADRLSGGTAGPLECVIACYENVCVLTTIENGTQLALSVDKDHALTVFQEILPKLRKLAA